MKKTLRKLAIWLFAEIFLNLIGLDDIADYSEFIFEHKLKTSEVILHQQNINKQINYQLSILTIPKAIQYSSISNLS
jgi:hypothetical protein